MTHVIIGTAGHIDHGKTTLIKALTGRSTDTLKEEIKRGISINLGFTYFDLPNGKRAGIIDVPGHERFIKNMIAGASGIDIVMLVVAANEGIMPQTVEHLDILSFLNIKESIVVLTKCGLADDDMIELVRQDFRERVKGGFMENAAIICVDSLSGVGLHELSAKLCELSDRVEERNEKAAARLYVDRVFSMKGFGTVVTGTLVEGKISVGAELMVYPQGLRARIRGVQVHEQSVESAYAGQRTALNISGLKASDLERGDVIAAVGSMNETDRLDVKINVVDHTKRQLVLWERLRVYHGSRELLARLVPLETDIIKAGDKDCLCQLRLEESICAKKGDKFVLRFYSPMETVGGGTILDANPKKHTRFSSEAIEALMMKDSKGLDDMISDYVEGEGEKGAGIKQIADAVLSSSEDILAVLNKLTENKTLIIMNDLYHHMNIYAGFINQVLEILSNFHDKNPLKPGMGKEELKSKMKSGIKQKNFDGFLRQAGHDGHIKVAENIVAITSFQVVFDEKMIAIKSEIICKLEAARFAAMDAKALTNNSKKIADVLDALLPDSIIRLTDGFYVLRKYYDEAKAEALAFIDRDGSVSVKDFRDKLDTSRKYALLLLENFDANEITRRLDDVRVRF